MKLKSKCCKKYKKKSDACQRCPLMARLNPEQRQEKLKKSKKKKAKRA